MPRLYLYPEARSLFSSLPSQSVAQLAAIVGRTYRAQRFELLWTRSRSLAVYRYPAPFILPKQAWAIRKGPLGWLIACRLGDRRWTLRLRGKTVRYHEAALTHLASTASCRGTLSLCRVAGSSGDHRAGISPTTQVVATFAGWFPRNSTDAQGMQVLTLRTDASCLWVAEIAGHSRVWRVNADHVRGWIATAARQQQRLREDLKAERRRPKRQMLGMTERMTQIAARRRRRLETFCHEVSAQLVGYARRQRVGTVVYVDEERNYLPLFPWWLLRLRLTEKLQAAGIGLVTRETTAGADRDSNDVEQRTDWDGLQIGPPPGPSAS